MGKQETEKIMMLPKRWVTSRVSVPGCQSKDYIGKPAEKQVDSK